LKTQGSVFSSQNREKAWRLEKRYITEATVINRISPLLEKEKFPKKMEEKKQHEQT